MPYKIGNIYGYTQKHIHIYIYIYIYIYWISSYTKSAINALNKDEHHTLGPRGKEYEGYHVTKLLL